MWYLVNGCWYTSLGLKTDRPHFIEFKSNGVMIIQKISIKTLFSNYIYHK